MEDFKLRLEKYIAQNYVEEISCDEDENFNTEKNAVCEDREKFSLADRFCACFLAFPNSRRKQKDEEEDFAVGAAVPNFNMIVKENKGETFSEMLTRLVNESGEKNSEIYNRANIDRRLFSKIVNHIDYQPAKNTVLAFAVALKLSYEMTLKLLDAAGFTLNKKNLTDVIITFFIENKIFDINTINETLYEYKQPLIGGGQKFCRLADDLL